MSIRIIYKYLMFSFILIVFSMNVFAQDEIRTLNPSKQELIQFDQNIQRIAVSDEEMINVELITNRQILVQAKEQGRTNVLIWFENGDIKDVSYHIGSIADRIEMVMQDAILKMENDIGKDVHVRRIIRGTFPNKEEDVFILEGNVPHQVALSQILSLASRILTGKSSDIKVIADETGSIIDNKESILTTGSSSSGSNSGTGRLRNLKLTNNIEASIARGTVLELAKGQILSYIRVTDIPRVRVSINFWEIDRDKLESYGSSLSTEVSTDEQTTNLRGNPSFQNIFDAISGSFANQSQLAVDHVAISALFSALKSKGIAKTLSNPTISVLSGEFASFLVGGQIPLITSTVNNVAAVQDTIFVDFGVELSVRPLVEEDDQIVLDIIPRVKDPVTNTFSSITSAPAFETKELKTSTKINDGQALIIGGLIKHNVTETNSKTPLLGDIPLLGYFFKDKSNRVQNTELFIVVTPTIERDPIKDDGLWQLPPITTEMIGKR